MAKIETYELVTLHKNLTALKKKNMGASGIRIDMRYLGENGNNIGSMEFLGEYLPELIPVLLASIEETLGTRRTMANSELAGIRTILPE